MRLDVSIDGGDVLNHLPRLLHFPGSVLISVFVPVDLTLDHLLGSVELLIHVDAHVLLEAVELGDLEFGVLDGLLQFCLELSLETPEPNVFIRDHALLAFFIGWDAGFVIRLDGTLQF